MLVDQQDSNILSLGRKPFKSFFDSRIVRLAVNDEEVFLRVRGLRNMLPSHQLFQERPSTGRYLTPIPARSRPVTES
jgi:hypothetical protein